MKQTIEAIYEDGVLRPLEPLNLANHERVSVTVETPGEEDWMDQDFMEQAQQEADPSVTLDEVRRALSKIPKSLADTIIEERGEY